MPRVRRNEWNFAHNAASLITDILRQPAYDGSPLGNAEPELTELNGARRLDLVIFKRNGGLEPQVTGELKVPWAADGRTPYNTRVVENAYTKAATAGVLYFITWNIRRVVAWQVDKPGVPLLQRVVYDQEIVPSTLPLQSPADIDHPEVRKALNEGVHELVSFLHSILTGLREATYLPLDRVFIARLEASLDYPIARTASALKEQMDASARFRREVERWMREEGWLVSKSAEAENIERAARFTSYVLVNRLCFYNALRRKYPQMSRLVVTGSVNTSERLRQRLNMFFEQAKRFTGNYETVFEGDFGDNIPFITDDTIPGWRELIQSLDHYDFANIDQDIIGAMYEQLIKPEERHRFGQHYTQPAVVDLINSFALARGDEQVLDPACGGGTFLVRAYARKTYLDPTQDHYQLLEQIYGCDILNYACHLSIINLAVRDLIDDDNFPRVRQGDFLRYTPGSLFQEQPVRIRAGGLPTENRPIVVEPRQFDAIVGNPPYIQAREMNQQDRETYNNSAQIDFPNYPWRRGSDIYGYFWTHAEKFLKRDGYLALLTQAAWLDVDYGVPIQKWMLDHFRIVAVLETETEPWFSDARVATVVTILKRENDPEERANHLVRFVQFRERLTNIIGATASEEGRQQAVERLRDRLLATAEDTNTAGYRLRLISQRDLEAKGTDDEGRYIGSKWGRYLRSPETVYRLQTQHSDRFVPLRTLARIQRGITTNCDDFFLVTDASAEILDSGISARALRDRFAVTRHQLESRQVAIVRRSDGVEMPLERQRLRPILKTARNYHWFATRGGPITDYVVFIPEGRDALSRMAREYVEAGEREGWHRSASFENLQNAGGNWYTLREADVAPILFVKTMQYTPLVILNNAELLANQRLYKAYPAGDIDTYAMCAVLNSTVIACERYAAVKALGREAAIDIEVFSANALRSPDLRRLNDRDVERLHAAMRELARREVSEMLEEPLRDIGFAAAKAYASRHPVTVDLLPPELRDETRQEIDRLVLKCIGVPQSDIERAREQMCLEIVEHIRKLRLLELEAQINRQGAAGGSAPSPRQLADEIWADVMETDRIQIQRVPDDFLAEGEEVFTVYLPAANRIVVEERSLFDSSHVYAFSLGRTRMEFENEDKRAYALLLAEHGATGDIPVPADSKRCRAVTQQIRAYLDTVVPRLREAAAGLTNNEDLQNKIVREAIKILVHR